MQSARRIVSVLELLKVARHADCRTLPRAVKIQKGLERLADSGTAAARVLQSCTCPSSCVSALPPSAQHTLPDVGAMASAAFCSTAAQQHCSCMPGPKAAPLGWLSKATKSCTPLLLPPMSRATFSAILVPPPSCSWGETTPGRFARNVPMVPHPPPPLLPDKIEVWTSLS
jgi:hypothetical protein